MTGSHAACPEKTASRTQDLPFSVRVSYRIRQFRHALTARPDPAQIERAKTVLSPAEFHLFSQMQPSEQVHSMQVLEQLQQQGQTHPALLAAALLHDIGKSRQPLAIWGRVVIVLGKSLFPAKVQTWGAETRSPTDLKKVFIIASQHPQWGADMAKQAGSQPLTVNLIRRHQEPVPAESDNLEDSLLRLLQAADGEN